MEVVIFILTVCGKPDIVAVQEYNKPGIYGYYEDIIRDEQAYKYLLSIKDKALVVVAPDERGICS